MSFLLILIIIAMLIGGGWWGWPLLAGALGTTAVTDKKSALENIVQLMRNFDITPGEVDAAYRAPVAENSATSQRSRGDISKTLFIYLGAIFILAGISTYIGTFWQSMGSVMRVFMTLGIGYILLIVLLSALYENKYPKLILPLVITAVFMMTGGWFVFVHEAFPRGDNWRLAALFATGGAVWQISAHGAGIHGTIFCVCIYACWPRPAGCSNGLYRHCIGRLPVPGCHGT